MDERLRGLAHIPGKEAHGMYILDLREQCIILEEQLRQAAESSSDHLQTLLESYIAARDELEFQSVRQALGFYRHKHQSPMSKDMGLFLCELSFSLRKPRKDYKFHCHSEGLWPVAISWYHLIYGSAVPTFHRKIAPSLRSWQ